MLRLRTWSASEEATNGSLNRTGDAELMTPRANAVARPRMSHEEPPRAVVNFSMSKIDESCPVRGNTS